MRTTMMWVLFGGVLHAGPFGPAAGSPGSEAIRFDDARFVAWANGNLAPVYGTEVDDVWKTPEKAHGPASDDVYDAVTLGNGGSIVMFFPNPIRDGEGPDFAVFENAFSHTFLELAFVSVSSDGVHFYEFPVISLTPNPVGPFSILGVDPTDIDGFAGKYRGDYGTPFDLAALPDAEFLDRENVRFVKVADIVGDGSVRDSLGHPIYDPTPTTGSGGFDLGAIGVIHQNTGGFRVLRGEPAEGGFVVEWESNPGSRYRVETSIDLEDWEEAESMAGEAGAASSWRMFPTAGEARRFWRVVRDD